MEIRWVMIGADADSDDATHLPAKVRINGNRLGVKHSLLLLTVR